LHLHLTLVHHTCSIVTPYHEQEAIRAQHTWRKVSMMAGPCAERVLLESPCKDIVMKASRVRGRFSAIWVTCLRPRKGLPGVSTFMAWYSALPTIAR